MYYYIVNPAAGAGSINNLQDKLKKLVTELGIDGEFVKTIGAGDAAKLAHQALEDKFKTIIAVGGNETVDEIVQAVYERGGRAAIGIIPIGKHNTLAGQLGVSDWRQACRTLAARRLVKIRPFSANGQLFFYRLSLTATAGQTPVGFTLTTKQGLKIKGSLSSATVTNQRILNPRYPNRLLIRIEPEPSGGGAWARWLPRRAVSGHGFSQFQTDDATINLTRPAEITGGLEPMQTDEITVQLDDQPVTFITDRQRGRQS